MLESNVRVGDSLFESQHFKKPREDLDYVVLEFKPEWDWIYENAKPTQLTEANLNQIEGILNRAVTEYNLGQAQNIKERKEWFEETYPNQDFEKSEPKLTLNLDDYKRQYFAVINENGQKEVWVNLFCTTEYSNWKEEIVIWHDGGNCFFNLKINLIKNSYRDFHVNGHA